VRLFAPFYDGRATFLTYEAEEEARDRLRPEVAFDPDEAPTLPILIFGILGDEKHRARCTTYTDRPTTTVECRDLYLGIAPHLVEMADDKDGDTEAMGQLDQGRERLPHVLVAMGIPTIRHVGHEGVPYDQLGPNRSDGMFKG
jgi:hypothetical protein